MYLFVIDYKNNSQKINNGVTNTYHNNKEKKGIRYILEKQMIYKSNS